MLSRVRTQKGWLSLDLSLALLVSGLLAVATYQATLEAADATAASLQADALIAMRGAAHKLVMLNYSAYQAASPITRNGVTLADGGASGQSRYPTVAQMRSLNLGVDSALDAGIYKSLTSAGYDIKMTRSSACTTTPAGADCHVTGLVCLSGAVKDRASASGEVDAVGQGVMLGRMGHVGGTSLLGNASTIVASDGSWSAVNPYGAVAGIVCAQFGWGSEADDYLRVSDTRDPSFQGGATVSGTISGGSYTLQANGNANVTGSLTVGATGTSGAVCTPEGTMAWGTVAGVPTLMRCQSGAWTATSTIVATDGASCSPEGRVAQNTSGAALICRGSAYRQLADLAGQAGIYSVATYTQGQVVSTPTCIGSNMTPRVQILGVVGACSVGGGSCDNNTGSFTAQIGSGNVLSITGSDGSTAGANAYATVATFCTSY
jgi:hypothetical protein